MKAQRLNLSTDGQALCDAVRRIVTAEPVVIDEVRITFRGEITYEVFKDDGSLYRTEHLGQLSISSHDGSDLVFYISPDGPDEALLYGTFFSDVEITLAECDAQPEKAQLVMATGASRIVISLPQYSAVDVLTGE